MLVQARGEHLVNGLVFGELERFVVGRDGDAGWRAVHRGAGLAERSYLPFCDYPDDELISLVDAVAAQREMAREDVLAAFGAHVVPGLLSIYGAMVKKSWRTLDVLENAEVVMHRAVRVRSTEARPPALVVERRGPRDVVIRYTSERRLCSFARGIVAGIGAHFGEQPRLVESTCMLRGDDGCTLAVRV